MVNHNSERACAACGKHRTHDNGLAPGRRKRKGYVGLRSSPREAGMSANARTRRSPVLTRSVRIRPTKDQDDDPDHLGENANC